MKFDSITEQLHIEMRSMSWDLRRMLEQMILEMNATSKGPMINDSRSSGSIDVKLNVVVTSSGENKVVHQIVTEHIDLTKHSRIQTKYSKLEYLRFDGNNFKGWLLKFDQFFEADQTRKMKVRVVMMHLDGKALQLHQRFMKNWEVLLR